MREKEQVKDALLHNMIANLCHPNYELITRRQERCKVEERQFGYGDRRDRYCTLPFHFSSTFLLPPLRNTSKKQFPSC